MTAFNLPKTLKSRLILCFLAVTIFPSVAISYFYYKSSQNTLDQNMIDTSVSSLNYSMTIIDKQLKNAEQLSDWVFINKNLDNTLTNNAGAQPRYNADIRAFLDAVEFQFRFNTSIGTYIYSLIIHGQNGLDLRAGQPEGTQINIAELQKTDWFRQGLSLQGKKFWYGVVKNPSNLQFENYILPMVRPVIHSFTNREIGWQMIGFRVNLIADLFKNFEIRPDEALMVLDSRGYCIYHSNLRRIGQRLRSLGYIATVLQSAHTQGHLTAKLHGASRMIVYAKSEATGWSIVRILSSAELARQKRLLLNITLLIFLSSIFFTSLLTVFLSSNLTHPLTKLLQQTKTIAAGNFSRDPAIEGRDELGVLGHGINDMAENIRRLLDRIIADEQEKRRLELAVLQNQVNPHFLYNTLNSLKLMATIQKADGIREMVTALGRLLMHLSKNTAEKISVAAELSLLNDYLSIQNIRYKGKIQLEYLIDDDTVLQCQIIKFTLQPLVENAIFHGIEPKKDAGRITIAIAGDAEHIYIKIEDDGVGMTPDQIATVLTGGPTGKNRGLSPIGIKNVNERLQLFYGPEYGLTIESAVDKFTRVCLKLPREVDESSAGVNQEPEIQER